MPVLDVGKIAARLPTKYSGVAAAASLLAHAVVFLALQVSGAAVLGSPAMAQDQAPDATGGQPRGITAVVPRSRIDRTHLSRRHCRGLVRFTPKAGNPWTPGQTWQ